jgi:SAM-dependent methyltransferase/uncharacterized protein YbaR (Trm112 family)
MAPRWLNILVDPIDRLPLRSNGSELIAASGKRYPIVEGIPVLLRADLPPTHRSSNRTLKVAASAQRGEPVDIVEALALPEGAKQQIRREIAAGSDPAEAAVRRLAPLTNGFAYRGLAPGDTVPIPKFPESGAGELLLDIGCAWGRWTIAAGRAGFRAIGIDPMLGHLIAAKRFAASRGVDADYICGDARCLPFADGAFDRVFSYSVLQHFSDEDCVATLREVGRVLKAGGASTAQMAHSVGARSLWHQARRGFRRPERFEVRYRSLHRMCAMFAEAIGPTSVSIDCFFGLGLQASDVSHMRPIARLATVMSECMKSLAHIAPALRAVADSLYLRSIRPH